MTQEIIIKGLELLRDSFPEDQLITELLNGAIDLILEKFNHANAIDFLTKEGWLQLHDQLINPDIPAMAVWKEHKAYCGNCGKRLYTKGNANYCHKCGKKVQWK